VPKKIQESTFNNFRASGSHRRGWFPHQPPLIKSNLQLSIPAGDDTSRGVKIAKL